MDLGGCVENHSYIKMLNSTVESYPAGLTNKPWVKY